MMCNRVLASLATGGAVARWRARRHLSRCARCAREQIQLQEFTRELTYVQPLTPAQRALWTAAGTEPVASTGRPAWFHAVGFLAATVVVGAVGLMIWLPHSGSNGARPGIANVVPQPSVPGLVQPSDRGKLADEMLAKVDRLDRELTELRREADLVDVRKRADALWAQFGTRKPSTL